MENEKYQELQVKSQKMEEEYEKQLHSLEESKSKAVAELKEHYEKKLKNRAVLLEEVGSLICSLICWPSLSSTVIKYSLGQERLASSMQTLICL